MTYLFIIWGKVKKGQNRGKKLGFPTANIKLHQDIPEGIYISQTKFKEKIFNSLTFIGTAKTYNENTYQAETYIFSFNQSLYDQWISIKLIKKIRENKKFNSQEELIKQMEEDKKEADDYFNVNSKFKIQNSKL